MDSADFQTRLNANASSEEKKRTYLVNHTVPGKPGVIDDDVNLATTKLD